MELIKSTVLFIFYICKNIKNIKDKQSAFINVFLAVLLLSRTFFNKLVKFSGNIMLIKNKIIIINNIENSFAEIKSYIIITNM